MSATMQIEDIANQALDLIGYKRHIGNIYDGTTAARLVLGMWAQTRDSLLIDKKPDWAKKQAVLVVAKTAPTQYDPTTPWTPAYPPLPWKYQYSYPEDCIYPLLLTVTPNTFPVWRPRYAAFRVNYDDGVQYLVANEPDAILAYIGNVFDIRLWESDFVDDIVITLAKKLAPLVQQRRLGQEEEKKDGGNPAG